jgi:hypothetical protein
MQSAQEAAMMDRCVIEVWTQGAADAYGVAAAAWVDGPEMACGLDLSQQKLGEAPSAEVSLAEGRLRLPLAGVGRGASRPP